MDFECKSRLFFCVSRLCSYQYWPQELNKDILEEKKDDDKTSLKDKLKNLIDLVEPENSTDYEIVANVSIDKVDVSYDYENEEYVDPPPDKDEPVTSCKCLPSCTSIHYDSEISQTNFDIIKYYKANKAYEKSSDQYVQAFVSIYFKEEHFIESKRKELYSWINFFSNVGGKYM